MNDVINTLYHLVDDGVHIMTLTQNLRYYQQIASGAKPTEGEIISPVEAENYVTGIQKCLDNKVTEFKQTPINHIPKPEAFYSSDLEKPYPVENLPSVLRGAIEAIASQVQAPIGLAAHSVLSAAAHLAQARVDVGPMLPFEVKPMPCSLYMLTLGDSGSRKTTCHKLGFKTIYDNEVAARVEFHRKDQGREHSNELAPQELMSDVVFEALASSLIQGYPFVTISSDDAGQWFGGHSLTSPTRIATCAGYSRLFDDGFVDRNRSKSNLNASGTATSRRVGVSLMAQEPVIRSFLMDGDLLQQGLLARFILTNTTSLAGTRFIDLEDLVSGKPLSPDPRLICFWNRCQEISEIPVTINSESGGVDSVPYYASDSAARLWGEYFNEVEKEQAVGNEFAHIHPFASRGGELCRRLATVIAYFSGQPNIDSSSMQAAIDIIDHSLHEWSRYTRIEADYSDEAQAMKLFKSLYDKKIWSFTKRQAQQRGTKPVRRSVKTLDRLLSILMDCRYIFGPDDTGQNLYLISPHVVQGSQHK